MEIGVENDALTANEKNALCDGVDREEAIEAKCAGDNLSRLRLWVANDARTDDAPWR